MSILEKLRELENSEDIALVCYDSGNSYEKLEEKCLTWKQYIQQIKNFSNYLQNNRLNNVAIHSFNSPEWFISAFGSIGNGNYFCGIYNTNRDEQCLHIIETGECDVLVVESQELLLNSYSNVLDKLENIKIIVINGDRLKLDNLLQKHNIEFWNELNLDKDTNNFPEIDISSTDICTLIFTSGTTGNPKAVELTNSNIDFTVKSVLNRIKLDYGQERIVSYLPLSHIAGQALDMYAPLYCKIQVHFADNKALKGTLKNTLLSARPTIFLGVPRIWEKFREGLIKAGENKYNNGIKGNILKYFMSLVKLIEQTYNTTYNEYTKALLYLPSLITNRIVGKIRNAIGLNECKYFVSGAAPITKDTLLYFSSIGINIFEIYGMSETTGVISISTPLSSINGSCGEPLDYTHVIIGKHNEILVKGNNVFKGYHNNYEKNDIDDDGFLHTGDCGEIIENELFITGRIKELIITAGGENIPPVLIENHIKKLLDTDSHVVLIGDKRKFLSMLVFDPENKLKEEDIEAARVLYNENHAISRSQKVQKYVIINEELSVENGLITPTMKLKRNKIVEKYNKYIEDMYN